MNLSELVDPNHAVIERLVAAAGDAGVSALRSELAGWRFVSRMGPSSYEDAERSRAGNCIDLAALLCAALRRTGNRDCHVLLGSWRGAFPAAVHAWVLVRSAADVWTLVDPNGMTERLRTVDEIERELTIVAVFDDTGIVASRSGLDAFWRSARVGEGEEQHVECN